MRFEVFGKRIEIRYKYPIPQNLTGAEKVEWVVAHQPKKRLTVSFENIDKFENVYVVRHD